MCADSRYWYGGRGAMRLVMTLRTRDHEDIVGAQLAFHLSGGVDFVIATDHLSVDGTRDVLREFERAGRLALICKDDERYEPGRWVNDMAQLACTDFGADWVLHTDADEFWWPHGGDLKDVLSSVPERFGAIFGPWRHFAPRPEDGSYFAERMTVRLGARGPWTAPEHPFHPNVNVAHRGAPDVVVRPGNHDVTIAAPVLRGWHPIEVLHFPLRSRAQAEAKFAAWSQVLERPGDVGPHVGAAASALRAGDFRERYDRYVVTDDMIESGAEGEGHAIDPRVRDALRSLAGRRHDPLPRSMRFSPAHVAQGRLTFPALPLAEEAALADDVSALPEPADRAQRRVAQLERRIVALEGRGARRRSAFGRKRP